METTSRIDSGGRVAIPAKYRKALGLRAGDEVVIRLEDAEVRLCSRKQARKRAQDYVLSLAGPHASLADELIRDRREEASRE